jgi:hypothetical protein
MSTHEEEFNDNLKELFRIFKELPSQEFKSKLHLREMQSKMARGMNAEPSYAILILGPLVWRAREEIVKRDAAFFLNRRYELELQELCMKHKINYVRSVNTVNFMKDAYKNASAEKQTQIFDIFNKLLAVYAQHVQAKRKEAD